MTDKQGGNEQELLRSAGLRVTPQRLAILRYLRGTRSHPSPETVYRQLAPEHPGLSQNTVYLTLRAFENAGLLRRVSMEENVFRYDANVTPHVHLVCRGCGRVDDANGELVPLLQKLGEAVRARCVRTDAPAKAGGVAGGGAAGWEVEAQDSCFYGLCPECRRKR